MSELVGQTVNWVKIASALAAGLCMGMGSLGPALGQGYIGGKACESIGKKPESSGVLNRTMFIALVFVESSSVYCLLISLVLLILS